MAYFSLRAYDADVHVSSFVGLQQYGPGNYSDVRYAEEEMNVETPAGVLQPLAANRLLQGEFENRIETVMRFTRRWFEDPAHNEWLVAASGGKLYYLQEDTDSNWSEIPMPSGIESFQSNVWSWVTYEVNEQEVSHPIDVLIISNDTDGMFMVVPPERPAKWNDVLGSTNTWGDYSSVTWDDVKSPVAWEIDNLNSNLPKDEDDQPMKFGVIERYAERIWGAAIPNYPDTLIYSAPFDPTDWEQNTEIPEDGAGQIDQPSWDGQTFTALKAFGDHLLAFKQHRVWKIMGTDPGQYTIREQFGGGAPFFNTIAVDVERIFMASKDGLSVYDGMSVSPYRQREIEKVWRTVNRDAMDQMTGALFKQRYYLAFPVGDSTVNNALLVYNFTDASILYSEGVYIESLLPAEEKLYATSSELPGKLLEIRYDSWKVGQASGMATKWVTPWMDFGQKQIQKGGFDLYISPEVQNESVVLSFSIQTEKKIKTKTYTVNPVAEPKEQKYKRLHFSAKGRKFRIIVETAEGVTAPWRLVGGLQLVVETDPD